jgi:MinD superfamily P-loop ATPase
MVERYSGYSYISETRFGPMLHAMLMTAEEASGELVAVVRENAKKLAEKYEKELIIIDGPPGIGCPVISSITGVDLVLIVTEPTLSAIHDLERILEVANHFDVPAVVCINKYDINEGRAADIEKYCRERNVKIVGKLPYDTVFTDAMIREKSVVEFSDGKISEEIKGMWDVIKKELGLAE